MFWRIPLLAVFIAAMFLCLPLHAHVVTSWEGVSVVCMSPTSIDHIAKSIGMAPAHDGVDRTGDLWTLWLTPEGGWWLTYRKRQTGEVCNVAVGDGWQKAAPGEDSH